MIKTTILVGLNPDGSAEAIATGSASDVTERFTKLCADGGGGFKEIALARNPMFQRRRKFEVTAEKTKKGKSK